MIEYAPLPTDLPQSDAGAAYISQIVESLLESDQVTQAVADAVVSASEQALTFQVDSDPAVMAGGEILIPDGEELIVIQQLLQGLIDYFQEDDNDLLSQIRDNSEDILDAVTEIRDADYSRPLMETPFEEYTVTEGLLLLILLWLVIQFCVKMLKGGFLWLR